MHFSPPRLHPSLITTDERRAFVRQQMATRASLRAALSAAEAPAEVAAEETVTIPLTTVSEGGNFDAWVEV
jgi:hypothetical protein